VLLAGGLLGFHFGPELGSYVNYSEEGLWWVGCVNVVTRNKKYVRFSAGIFDFLQD
jgi:hypothetical protein